VFFVLPSQVTLITRLPLLSFPIPRDVFQTFHRVRQVIKSACLAARSVPSSAIIPKGVKDIASRFVLH
jgi:hypothetical protein